MQVWDMLPRLLLQLWWWVVPKQFFVGMASCGCAFPANAVDTLGAPAPIAAPLDPDVAPAGTVLSLATVLHHTICYMRRCGSADGAAAKAGCYRLRPKKIGAALLLLLLLLLLLECFAVGTRWLGCFCPCRQSSTRSCVFKGAGTRWQTLT